MIDNLSKRQSLMNKMKELQKEIMIKEATNLFLERGISEVTIKDVAKDLGVGEATIYRYFSKKQNLVIECAINLWKYILDNYIGKITEGNGYSRIEQLLNIYKELFRYHTDYFRFINEFDTYIESTEIEPKLLSNYSELFFALEGKFNFFYQIGLLDDSLKIITNLHSFYLMFTTSLLGLCKKLSNKDKVMNNLSQEEKLAQIDLFINMLLKEMKKD